MPATKSARTASGSSKALVPTGPKHISARPSSGSGQNKELPTTTRAVILRNGKYGAVGTGELILSKISGREKLDFLAEDLVEKKLAKAVASNFKLERCIQIAESQFDAYLDEISSLQDPEIFRHVFETKMKSENNARTAGTTDSASRVATLVATTIHNAYMQASAWKLVLDTFRELDAAGFDDANIKQQLKNSIIIRSRFLVLYELVNVLVNMCQQRFSVLAATTPHYSPYFKVMNTSDPDEPEIVFDWERLREACKSFIDSIIIELCFPRAPYPKFILCQILHEAVEESPKHAKVFPQAMWDAIGDLSVVVELQELLEQPLLGPDGQSLKALAREMPPEYDLWLDAQLQSHKASSYIQNYKNLIYPFDKLRAPQVLENMWKCINLNYKSVCGKDVETLWQLNNCHRTPQWHAIRVSKFPSGSDSDSDVPRKKITRKKGKLLAITEGREEDGYDSMPALQTVSESSAAEDTDTDDGFFGSDDTDNDSDSEYDEELEDELREMRREAMDFAHDIPGFFDNHTPLPTDPFADYGKGNPFAKILGSLRGRMFSSNPKLKTTKTSPPSGTTGVGQTTPLPKPVVHLETPQSTEGPPGISTAPQSHKVSVEEVVDEEVPRAQKKKKPRKKKKKKAASTTQQEPVPDIIDTPSLVQTASPPAATPQLQPQPPSLPTQKREPEPKPPAAPRRPPSINASTTTLPLQQTTAESARKYLQSENLGTQKSKVKSRPDHPTMSPVSEKKEKKGFFSRFSKEKSKVDEGQMKSAKHSWFNRLSKKATDAMRQMLQNKAVASMKWDQFLKLMTEMGFSVDPSTAGSSVRFDPPDKQDKSITIHKPHPDPTISPIKLREISRRLKEYYGWTEEDFLKHAK